MKTQTLTFIQSFFGYILTYIIAFFTPINIFILGVGFMVIADLITGLLKAHKNKTPIKSNKMFRTIPKFIAYTIGIICAQIIFVLFAVEFPVVKMVAGLIAFIELKSIDENIEAITGHSIFTSIIDKFNPKKKEL